MQGEVDMAHLKKTIQELESIVDRLERINKEQVIPEGKTVCACARSRVRACMRVCSLRGCAAHVD